MQCGTRIAASAAASVTVCATTSKPTNLTCLGVTSNRLVGWGGGSRTYTLDVVYQLLDTLTPSHQFEVRPIAGVSASTVSTERRHFDLLVIELGYKC